jgi:hypothetical protein
MTADPPAPAHAPPAVDPAAAIAVLRQSLVAVVSTEALTWLDAEIERQRAGLDERRLGIALGRAGRKFGRRDLALPPEVLAAAQGLRSGWQPQFWATDETARVALLLATHHGDDHAFAVRLDKLCATAEVTEHISYLKGLALFPAGKALLERAREGVRSSITPVFAAVACRNPYPFDYFDAAAWNQMVVKCVFVGESLDTITGLHERRNPELIQMLRDLAAERQAAGRPLPTSVHDFITGRFAGPGRFTLAAP